MIKYVNSTIIKYFPVIIDEKPNITIAFISLKFWILSLKQNKPG